MSAMTMLMAFPSFLGNPNGKLRRPGAREEKHPNGAWSASKLGAHKIYRFRGLETMLWITTRLHAISTGVAKTGVTKTGEKEATLAAVADLCFCEGKCTCTQHPEELVLQKEKKASMTDSNIQWHYRYKLDGVSVNYHQSDGISTIF
jgi:hypothetical protein